MNTLEELQKRNTRRVHFREEAHEGQMRVVPVEPEADGSVPEGCSTWVIKRVLLADVKLEGIRIVLGEDQMRRWAADYMKRANAAYRASLEKPPELHEDKDTEEERRSLEELSLLADAIGEAAVLRAAMVEPTFDEAWPIIKDGPYEAALLQQVQIFAGVTFDP